MWLNYLNQRTTALFSIWIQKTQKQVCKADSVPFKKAFFGTVSAEIRTHSKDKINYNKLPAHLSLQAPFHSVLPQGFLIRIRGMVSFLKYASSPWPKRTLFTAVTEYAWPFTSPFIILSSISWGCACNILQTITIGMFKVLKTQRRVYSETAQTLMEQLMIPPRSYTFSRSSKSLSCFPWSL